MADGDVSGKLGDVLFLERLPDESHGDFQMYAVAGAGGDACALLPAVLEGVEAEECVSRDILAFGVYADYAASLTRVVVSRGCGRIGMPRGVAVHSQLRSLVRFHGVAITVSV